MKRLDLRAPSTYVPLLLLVLALAAPAVVPPLVVPLGYSAAFVRDILVNVCIFALLGVSWNILGGYAGQLSLGHAAYFGIGAYTSTLLLVKAGVPTVAGLFLGGLMAMLVSIFIGLASFRLRGPYFAIATIATAETLRLLALKFSGLTYGAMGTTIPFKGNDPIDLQFTDKVSYYYVGLASLLVAVAVTAYVARSRLGYYLVAVGQDEDAAEAVGIRSPWVKQQANFISAFFAGLAGTLSVQYTYFIEPESVFGLQVSVNAVLVAIVGGVGTLWGPVIGALLLTPLSSTIQASLGNSFPGAQLIVYALVMIAVILFRPSGLVGLLAPAYRRFLSALPGAGIDRRRIQKAEEARRASPA
jgi:branched-chain amino acid transport system permease protein